MFVSLSTFIPISISVFSRPPLAKRRKLIKSILWEFYDYRGEISSYCLHVHHHKGHLINLDNILSLKKTRRVSIRKQPDFDDRNQTHLTLGMVSTREKTIKYLETFLSAALHVLLWTCENRGREKRARWETKRCCSEHA